MANDHLSVAGRRQWRAGRLDHGRARYLTVSIEDEPSRQVWSWS
jgi:hypothetical protein